MWALRAKGRRPSRLHRFVLPDRAGGSSLGPMVLGTVGGVPHVHGR